MQLKKWEWIGALFAAVMGSLIHFTYEWSGGNTIVAAFSAVNESTWEHLKLLAVPMILFSLLEYRFVKKTVPNFIPVKLLSVLVGMAAIIVSFYTYVGILGFHFLAADIGTFLFGILAAYSFSARCFKSQRFCSGKAQVWGWIGMGILILCMILFTFYPPQIGLFQDPVTGGYGIAG